MKFNYTLFLSFVTIGLLVSPVFAEDPHSEIDSQNNLKNIQEKIDNLIKNNEEILKSIKSIEDNSKLYNDKFSLIEKETEDIKSRIDHINEDILKLNTNQSDDKLTLNKLTNEIEGFKLKFDIVNDEIKIKTDDIKSIRESISVLKRNLDSNIENTVECKKSLTELLAQKNNKEQTIEDTLKWEYWGVVAGGVAVIALILAIAK